MSDPIKSKRQISWLYWGTLITSLGTYTFPGAAIGVLTDMGYPLFLIGLLMAMTRLGTILGSFFFGDLSDRYNPKTVVFWTEVMAFLTTVGLIVGWSLGQEYFYVFLVFTFVRYVIISIGGPGRNKMLKVINDGYKSDHFQSGITLNLVTYGPTLIGAIFGYLAIKYLSFYWVLGFDALTFLLNGLILYRFVDVSSEAKATESNLFSKVSAYFSDKKSKRSISPRC